MTDELLTARELQELLRVDRTTIYSMLKEGRLPGFKVGGQWRFSRQEIRIWLEKQRAEAEQIPVHPSPDVLPLDCVQSIQAIFSEAMDVSSIATRLDGQPLTQTSNACAFCNLMMSTPEGFQRCVGSWHALAGQKEQKPRLCKCHAGLLYARGQIKVEDEFVAMVFAGQMVVDGILETISSRADELATVCRVDPAQLHDALPSVHSLTTERSEQLIRLLGRLAETLSVIGRERLALLRKLRHIAEVTAV